MPSLEGFRDYARLDEEDPSAEACFTAAIGYGAQAGVARRENSPLYDMFIYALALHFFDNRGFSPGVQTHAGQQNDFVDRWITKLKIMLALEDNEVPDGNEEGGDAGGP